jgi:hypothetical protein
VKKQRGESGRVEMARDSIAKRTKIGIGTDFGSGVLILVLFIEDAKVESHAPDVTARDMESDCAVSVGLRPASANPIEFGRPHFGYGNCWFDVATVGLCLVVRQGARRLRCLRRSNTDGCVTNTSAVGGQVAGRP